MTYSKLCGLAVGSEAVTGGLVSTVAGFRGLQGVTFNSFRYHRAPSVTQTPDTTRLLYSSLGGDPDLGEIVELFVEEMPDRVATLLDQLEAADWEGLHRAAHQLKGAAGSYGYAPISDYAAVLEKAVGEGEPEEQIREAVDALADICRRARGGTPS